MPERDWIADEMSLQNSGNANSKVIALAALDERRRLAEELHLADGVARLAIKHRDLAEALLTWKPGPPTEPGFFAFTLSSGGLPYCEELAANDFEIGVRPWLKEVVWHLGPLPIPPDGSVFRHIPEPPKAEASNG